MTQAERQTDREKKPMPDRPMQPEEPRRQGAAKEAAPEQQLRKQEKQKNVRLQHIGGPGT